MPSFIRAAAFLSCAGLLLAGGPAFPQAVSDDLNYINCEAGIGIIFPEAPMERNVPYTTNTGRTVQARQISVQRGQDLYRVTVARFDYGPLVDEAAMDHAAAARKAQGDVRYEEAGAYDPGFPGRQLSIVTQGGRQLRVAIFMMEHKLYIIEADTAPGDVAAIQFEQSATMVNEMGVDYDQNPPDPIHRLTCRSDYFRR